MHRIKVFFGNFVLLIGGTLFVRLIEIVGKSQLSGSILIRSLGYLPSLLVDRLLGLKVFRITSYISRRSKELRKSRGRIKNTVLRSFLHVVLSSKDAVVIKQIDSTHYRQLIAAEQIDAEDQYLLGHRLMHAGRLDLACETFADVIDRSFNKLPLERRLQLYRDCGIAHFMYGRNREANYYWTLAGKLRRSILGPIAKYPYRVIGHSWFAAIGHVAMLDYYKKYILLFRDSSSHTVIFKEVCSVPGSYLLSKSKNNGFTFLDPNLPDEALEKDYDKWAIQHGLRLWQELTPADKAALVDDFWEYDFPDGAILGYTHALARIQQEWERRGLQPLLSVSEEDQAFIASILDLLDVPKGAWYVCLHVRETGFHRQWNALYPSMRDAEIDDYRLAIEEIVARGGWVIRMGDSTMKPLPKMHGVVDYAHSQLKTPVADVLIPLGSRFLLGTNSGYATVPANYGIRCAFTNWVPIGMPIWSGQDLMIPKLFWHEQRQRYLSLDEIFETGLAFLQNCSELPAGITLIKNTPEDIWALAEEMLAITANEIPAEKQTASKRFHPTYRRIAERHESYVGSYLGSAFIERHPTVFTDISDDKAGAETLAITDNTPITETPTA